MSDSIFPLFEIPYETLRMVQDRYPPSPERAKQHIDFLNDDLQAVPVISEKFTPEDLAALERLVMVAAKHSKLTRPHWNDESFMEKLFELVMAKLPESVGRAQFILAVPKLEKKMFDVRKFTENLLIEQWTKIQAVSFPSGQFLYCAFCKSQANHEIDDCVKVRYNCFVYLFLLGPRTNKKQKKSLKKSVSAKQIWHKVFSTTFFVFILKSYLIFHVLIYIFFSNSHQIKKRICMRCLTFGHGAKFCPNKEEFSADAFFYFPGGPYAQK